MTHFGAWREWMTEQNAANSLTGTDRLEPVVPKPLEISNGKLVAKISQLGATLRDLRMKGVEFPLVLGWRDEEDYFDNDDYLGPLVGRCANRISGGTFEIAGRSFNVDRNSLNKHTLHGGSDGTDKHVWNVETQSERQLILSLCLPNGHMGFGGQLDIQANFQILEPASLRLEILARSKGTSLCNIAPHWYFNLDGSVDVTGHQLQILADSYLPVDRDLIPTGSVERVDHTDFDFRRPTTVGSFPYDHNFCTSDDRQAERTIARLWGATSGVSMEIASTEPGLQVYTGAYLEQPRKPTLIGRPYSRFAGIALEPQCWPDAPNNTGFPSVALKEGDLYRHASTFSFSKLSTNLRA